MELLDGRPLAQRLVHQEVPLAGWRHQLLEQLLPREPVEVLHEPQAVAVFLQGTDRLLERLLVGLADAHHLAGGAHLRSQPVFHALELLKGPARELHHDVIAAGHVFIQRAVLPAGNILQRQARSQLGGHQRDGEPRGLRRQRRRAGRARVDLDDNDAVRPGIVGKLHVGAADDPDVLNDFIRLLLESGLKLL